jgi:hypothetical protein
MTKQMNNVLNDEMPDSTLNEKQYALNYWTIEDILARFPAATPASAHDFLAKFEHHIVDGMIDGAWEVIDALARMNMGWQRSGEDEEDAYERAQDTMGQP